MASAGGDTQSLSDGVHCVLLIKCVQLNPVYLCCGFRRSALFQRLLRLVSESDGTLNDQRAARRLNVSFDAGWDAEASTDV